MTDFTGLEAKRLSLSRILFTPTHRGEHTGKECAGGDDSPTAVLMSITRQSLSRFSLATATWNMSGHNTCSSDLHWLPRQAISSGLEQPHWR